MVKRKVYHVTKNKRKGWDLKVAKAKRAMIMDRITKFLVVIVL